MLATIQSKYLKKFDLKLSNEISINVTEYNSKLLKMITLSQILTVLS